MSDDRITLLSGGGAAFEELLRLCGGARRSIDLNMFIWRDDEIGDRLGRALLQAADRGVRVTVSKDRYGGVYERAEETGQSFWHKGPDPLCGAAGLALRCIVPADRRAPAVRQRPSPLAESLRRHPNVTVDAGRFKLDHSKYYVFDEETLVLGGVNVEDKEITADITGAVYHDYMAEVRSAAEVRYFRDRLAGRAAYDPRRAVDYFFNGLSEGRRRFGILPGFLSVIAGARRSLRIMMPYIGERRLNAALLQAAERGVEVLLVLPKKANLQHDYNMRAAERLYRDSGGLISVWLTPLMCHAKLMIADEDVVTLGSANMNRDATSRGLELNCVSRDNGFVAAALTDFEAHRAEAERHISFSYARLPALLEGFYAG